MATLAELCAAHTGLDDAAVEHLLSLTASWSLLADLSFSDLLLVAPAGGSGLVVLGQVRPNNRPTLVGEDLVGSTLDAADWPLVGEALAGERRVGPAAPRQAEEPVELWAVPVRFSGRVVAVLVRLLGPVLGGSSAYQQVYLSVFARVCDMVAESEFPFREAGVAGPGLPRVGDGIVLLDGAGRVEFATPNATSALHRLGVAGATEGRRLDELGLRVRVVERALDYGLPSLEEVDAGHDVAILCQAVPLLARGECHRGGAADARRVGPQDAQPRGDEQGVGGARGAPPGQEQPPDDLVAPAAPGAPQRPGRGPQRAARGRAPGALDRRRPRGPEPRAGRGGRLRRDRAQPGAAGRGHGPRAAPGRDRRARRARGAAVGPGHAARGRPGRAA